MDSLLCFASVNWFLIHQDKMTSFPAAISNTSCRYQCWWIGKRYITVKQEISRYRDLSILSSDYTNYNAAFLMVSYLPSPAHANLSFVNVRKCSFNVKCLPSYPNYDSQAYTSNDIGDMMMHGHNEDHPNHVQFMRTYNYLTANVQTVQLTYMQHSCFIPLQFWISTIKFCTPSQYNDHYPRHMDSRHVIRPCNIYNRTAHTVA